MSVASVRAQIAAAVTNNARPGVVKVTRAEAKAITKEATADGTVSAGERAAIAKFFESRDRIELEGPYAPPPRPALPAGQVRPLIGGAAADEFLAFLQRYPA